MKKISLDFSKPGSAEPEKGHNRWHPDIPPILRVSQGEEVIMDTRDGLDMQITPDSNARDILNMDLNPNPPMDMDGRREDSGRGVRELQGR